MHARLLTTVCQAAIIHIGFTSRAEAHTAGCKCINYAHQPGLLSGVYSLFILLVAAAGKQAAWHLLLCLWNTPSLLCWAAACWAAGNYKLAKTFTGAQCPFLMLQTAQACQEEPLLLCQLLSEDSNCITTSQVRQSASAYEQSYR